MRRAVGRSRRRAYILIVVIATMGLLLVAAVVLARIATVELRRERMALLEAAAEQVLHSARGWSGLHADRLETDVTVTLPVDELFSPGVSGTVDLSRDVGDRTASGVACVLTLHHGRYRLIRQVHWPVAAPASENPAVVPATP